MIQCSPEQIIRDRIFIIEHFDGDGISISVDGEYLYLKNFEILDFLAAYFYGDDESGF